MPCDRIPAQSQINASRGFTLIELLVAITILAIVAVLGWRGLDSIVRARIALNASMEQTRGIQLAFAQIENDGAHLIDAGLMPGRSVLSAAGNKLMLIRSVSEENQPTRYQIVVYSVNDSQLARRESLPTRELAVLKQDWQNAADDSDSWGRIVLQKDVAQIAMRTWKLGETGWRVGGSDVQNTTDQNKVKNGIAADSLNKTAKLTGLEVSLLVQGLSAPMIKVFLLGAG